MSDSKVIFLVGTQIDAARDEKYNEWYNSTHIPMNLKSNCIDRVTRYKLSPESEGDYPQYIAQYEFKDRQAYDAWATGPAREAARANTQEVWEGKGAEIKWRAVYEEIKSWSG